MHYRRTTVDQTKAQVTDFSTICGYKHIVTILKQKGLKNNTNFDLNFEQ